MLSCTLASIHNEYFISKLVQDMRSAIINDTFFEFKEAFLAKYKKVEIEEPTQEELRQKSEERKRR